MVRGGAGLLSSVKNPGGSAGGPLCHRGVSLIGQGVAVGVGGRGDDLVAAGRVHVVTSQVRHGRGQRHVRMVLRVVVIVGLRTVVHVRDLGLVVLAAVRRLVGVVVLSGVLARVHGRGGGGGRRPGEAGRMVLAVVDLVDRGRVGGRLQLARARRQRRRRRRQVAVAGAAAGRRRPHPRIRRRGGEQRRAAGRRRFSALRRRIRRGSSAGRRRRRAGRRYPVGRVAVAAVIRPRRALGRRWGLLLLQLLSALCPPVLEPDLQQRKNLSFRARFSSNSSENQSSSRSHKSLPQGPPGRKGVPNGELIGAMGK